VLVIFLFLRSLYATIIPSVAVPLSLVALSGDVPAGLQPGQLIDDARPSPPGCWWTMPSYDREHLAVHRSGAAPMEAALKGARNSFTILSLSVSLIAVLIPLLFMGDGGRLFRRLP